MITAHPSATPKLPHCAVHVVVPRSGRRQADPAACSGDWACCVRQERYTRCLVRHDGVLSPPLFYPVLAVQDAGEQAGISTSAGAGDGLHAGSAYDVTAIVPPTTRLPAAAR